MTITYGALGKEIKYRRSSLNLTQAQLAERLSISTRYIMLIENSKKKPSFNLLCRIIYMPHLHPDSIFYPEKPSKDSQVEDIVRMLYNSDERSIKIIRATVQAALESQRKEAT